MADQTIAHSGPRNSWDRKPDESFRAWTAFQAFRDSADRKLKTVAAALNPPCSIANVGRWSQRHQWGPRSADWDRHVDEEQRGELARGRVARRRKQLQFASALQSVAAHALREYQVKVEMKLPLNMPAESITGLLKLADQLETSAFGSEHENKFTAINVLVGSYRDEQQYEAQLKIGMLGVTRDHLPVEDAITIEEFQRRQWERLTDEEKAAQSAYRDPPRKLTN
jgi:hypothetical protein